MGAFIRKLAALVLVALTHARADEASAPRLGETRWLGSQPFQFVGMDERGSELWLYPHQDGVPELFAATSGGTLLGSLESRYDPATGTFTRRFSAVEVLNELDAADGARARRGPARLLAVFLALTPSVPYYLRDVAGAVAAALTPEDVAWVDATVAFQRAALARLTEVGTRAHPAPTRLLTLDEHYAALTDDGYLDVVVVGGNSRDEKTGTFYSWDLVAALADELTRAGYARAGFRGADDRTLREKTVAVRGRPTRVRVQLTGGSSRRDRVRRNVANFVEGLARADVVIYLGHSNKESGCYYLAESKSAFSRFYIGDSSDGHDLAAKCHELGRRGHQLILLQSCSSFPKYAQPLTAFFRAAGAAVPGFAGTTELAYFDEFVPRYRALLELLLEGAGPRAIAHAMRVAPRRPDAAPTLLRGVLQPRASFVVPADVSIIRTDDLGEADGFQLVGQGSDGLVYPSTEVFPQDRPGDVVQAVACARGVYGLYRDGRLVRVGPETKGDCLPVAAPGLTLRYIARVLRPGGHERLCALDETGRVHVVGDGALSPLEPPAPAPLVAIGNDARGRVLGRDAAGRTLVFRAADKTWDPTTAAPFMGAAPSLASSVTPGVLWLGVAEQGRVVPP